MLVIKTLLPQYQGLLLKFINFGFQYALWHVIWQRETQFNKQNQFLINYEKVNSEFCKCPNAFGNGFGHNGL